MTDDGSAAEGIDDALLGRALRDAPVGVTVTDVQRDGNPFVYANGAFVALTGYDGDEILDRSYPFLFGSEAGEAADRVVGAVDRRESLETDVAIERADGTSFVNHLRLSPCGDDDGRYVVGIHDDVTEEREARLELERENERLDEFASIVSHDLRNPLGVASKRLEAYREDHDDPRLEQVDRGISQMEDLIDNLLAVARHGRTVSPSDRVEIETVAASAWDNVETRDGDLAVESTTTLTADPDSLRRVLENLFKNAIEHGGSDVTVTVGETADGFYVEDDGTGIAEVERDVVFDRGYSDDGGTGFGLYIVESIAEAHGWTVTVEDNEAGGARFAFAADGGG